MVTRSVVLFLGLCAALFLGSTNAGELEPPGPPGPTMATLQELFDRLASGSSSPDDCFDNAGRFTVCGNGTVKDTLTGLYWLEDAACITATDWAGANLSAAQLGDGQCGLTDGSSPGDWRLPTDGEWQVIADQATSNGCSAPFVPDVAGTGCCGTGTCAFSGISSNVYWSSTTNPGLPVTAFSMNLGNGILGGAGKTFDLRGWAVRSGR